MYHRIAGRKFSRTTNQRKALMISLSKALITSERIITTLPKAKSLRPLVERWVTVGKKGTLAARRQILSYFREDEVIQRKLVDVLGKRYESRNGGYTRIFKAGYRAGDNAPMAIIEFVEEEVGGKETGSRTRSSHKATKAGKEASTRDKRLRGNKAESSEGEVSVATDEGNETSGDIQVQEIAQEESSDKSTSES